MVYKVEERVKETVTGMTGTGAYKPLDGAPNASFQAFSAAYANGDTFPYCATDNSGNFERGIGTYVSATNEITRTTVVSSSNADAAVNWAGETIDIFVFPLGVRGYSQIADATGAAIAVTDGNFLVGDGSGWVAESGATARASMGLGTGDTPTFAGVNLGDENLDHYDEGTWTPTIIGETVAGSQTYGGQDGDYIRIGSLIIAWFRVSLTAKDAAMDGNVLIGGLPFTAANDQGHVGGALSEYTNVNTQGTGTAQVGLRPKINTATAYLTESVDNTAFAIMDDAELAATAGFHGTLIYSV